MRSERGQFLKGESGNPKGRPKKADDQFLVELWDESGKEVFSESVRRGERWAVKLLVDKLYANKKTEAGVFNGASEIRFVQLPIEIAEKNSLVNKVG